MRSAAKHLLCTLADRNAMRAPTYALAALALTISLPAQSTWFVDPAGDDANTGTAPGAAAAFQTVNHANSVASSGDVVRLAGATFGAEQGVIVLGDKDLTVVGAGAATTILRAHPSNTINVNRGFPSSPVPTQQRPIVLVEGGGEVRFRGVTFDGDFQVPPTGFLIGLVYRDGADGLLEDCVIRNCRANPVSGSNAPAGVVVRGDNGADPCEVELRNCVVHDFGKVGVVAFFNASIEMVGGYIRGSGPDTAAPAQVGVQISYDADGHIRGATITDLYYTPSSVVGTAIITYDAADATIDGNHIGNCEQGIFCTHTSTNSSSVTIRENKVHNAEAGITLQNIATAQVLSNKFQLRSAAFTVAAYDDVSGHQWIGNNYSTYSGSGPKFIPGPGGNVDQAATTDVEMLSGAATITSLPTLSEPVAITVAALRDSVQIDDFAVAHADLSISVGLNTGAGNFTVTNTQLPPSNATPIAITTGQFDAAPGLDLAVLVVDATAAASAVVLFSNDGAGGFTLAGAVALTGLPSATGFASADLVSGGGSDLIVSGANSAGGGALLLANSGAGTFVQSALAGSFTLPLQAVAAGKFDGDSITDVALLEGGASGGDLTIMLGDGVGNFTARPSQSVSENPRCLIASDLDGDGDDDLIGGFGDPAATTGAIRGSLVVLENEVANGFRQSTYPADLAITALSPGDLDDDASPDAKFGDIAAISAGNPGVLVFGDYRTGAGFGDGGIATDNPSPTAVALGNADGDPFEDLFFADTSGRVIIQTGEVQARIDNYGSGCRGTAARIPRLYVSSYPAPLLGLTNFTIELTNARPLSIGLIPISLTPPTTLSPCAPQLDTLGVISIPTGITDNAGRMTQQLQLPSNPAVLGLKIYFAGAVVDPEAPSFAGIVNLAFTEGLQARIGS